MQIKLCKVQGTAHNQQLPPPFNHYPSRLCKLQPKNHISSLNLHFKFDAVMGRKIAVILAFLIIFSMFTFIGMMMGSSGGKPPVKKEQVALSNSVVLTNVDVKRIQSESVPLVLKGHGRVTSANALTINPEAQGRLIKTKFNLKKGERFVKGQALFRIDDTEARLLLKARKSSFLNLLANALIIIKTDYPDRNSDWTNFFNKVDIEKNLPKIPEAKSSKEKTFLASKGILAEYYGILSDESKLRKYVYYAPFNGTITMSYMSLGAIVSPSSRIAEVMEQRKLEIEIPLSAEQVNFVNRGDKVELIDGTKVYRGSVARIGDFVDQQTQSIPVFVSLNQHSKNLRNGMYLEAKINCGSINSGIKLPRRAIVEGGDNSSVKMVKDSMLSEVPVNIIFLNDDEAVVNGLTDGEFVVVEPLLNSKVGDKVNPIVL